MIVKKMSRIRHWVLGAALVGAGTLAAVSAQPADAMVRHLRLVRSMPAADAVIDKSPEEVRVVFSEVPGTGTSLRLTQGETLVETTTISADSTGTQFFVKPSKPLAGGEYTAHWRVVARDGHAQNGTFSFKVDVAE